MASAGAARSAVSARPARRPAERRHSPLEQHQGRNAPDVVAGRQPRLAFGVHLEKSDVRLELGANPLVDWRHCFAWPAPWRPEVDQHRDVVAPDVGLELVVEAGTGLPLKSAGGSFPHFALRASFPLGMRFTLLQWDRRRAGSLRSWMTSPVLRRLSLRSLRSESSGRVDRHQPLPVFM